MESNSSLHTVVHGKENHCWVWGRLGAQGQHRLICFGVTLCHVSFNQTSIWIKEREKKQQCLAGYFLWHIKLHFMVCNLRYIGHCFCQFTAFAWHVFLKLPMFVHLSPSHFFCPKAFIALFIVVNEYFCAVGSRRIPREPIKTQNNRLTFTHEIDWFMEFNDVQVSIESSGNLNGYMLLCMRHSTCFQRRSLKVAWKLLVMFLLPLIAQRLVFKGPPPAALFHVEGKKKIRQSYRENIRILCNFVWLNLNENGHSK